MLRLNPKNSGQFLPILFPGVIWVSSHFFFFYSICLFFFFTNLISYYFGVIISLAITTGVYHSFLISLNLHFLHRQFYSVHDFKHYLKCFTSIYHKPRFLFDTEAFFKLYVDSSLSDNKTEHIQNWIHFGFRHIVSSFFHMPLKISSVFTSGTFCDIEFY